jgi:hypothetical protein
MEQDFAPILLSAASKRITSGTVSDLMRQPIRNGLATEF